MQPTRRGRRGSTEHGVVLNRAGALTRGAVRNTYSARLFPIQLADILEAIELLAGPSFDADFPDQFGHIDTRNLPVKARRGFL